MATAERLVAFLQEHQGGAVTRDALAALNAADLRAFLANRRMDGIGTNSTARELSAVRGFLKFIGGEDARVHAVKGQCVKPGVHRPYPPDYLGAPDTDVRVQGQETRSGAC